MIIRLVFAGIAAGLLAAASVLAFGGGIGLAILTYVGAGLVGMCVGLASAFLPRHQGAVMVSQDHG